MKRILFHCEHYNTLVLNLGLLFVRIYFGLTMAFAHGINKLPPSEKFIGFISSLPLPLPELMAWSAGLSEFIGGLFIAIGLMTRFFGASWIITMGVAAFMVHANDPFHKQEPALGFLVIGLFLFLSGAGKYSIDGLIHKK